MTVTKAERIIMAQNIRILNHLEEITKSNEIGVAVKAKHALLNYTEAILSFLS